jgi:predicted RNase H-like nuclease (RuvC/YqgF family)
MTRDEIVTALRCCAEPGRDCDEDCPMNEISCEPCRTVLAPSAADLIENQQRHIAALMKANDSLKDAIARRDKQIETLKKQVEVMAREQDAMGRRIAMREENQWTKTY